MVLRTPPILREIAQEPAQSGRIILPKPYASWQSELINSPVKLAVFALGTKCGKTLGLSTRFIRESYTSPSSRSPYFRILAPYYRHTAITYKYINRLVPQKLRYDERLSPEENERAQEAWERLTLERSESKRTFSWPHNGATIECMHGQDPAAIEGEAVDGQGIDEAAKFKEDSYAAAMSTTTQRGGWTVLISTPRGKNWFYRVAMECAEREAWCKRNGKPVTHIFRTVPTWTSPFVSEEIIENAKRTMPDRLFRTLYGGEFVDDGTVFTELSTAFGGAIEFTADDKWIAASHNSRCAFIGVDWAKQTDYTVFYALNERGETLGWWRLQKLSYPTQVGMLWSFCDTIRNNAQEKSIFETSVLFDKTGVGEAISDIIDSSIDKHDVNIRGLSWTNSLKEVYVNDMILSLEEHALKLKPWMQLKSELDAFEVDTSPSGNPIYKAPEGEGFHDDCVMSIILANMLFRENRSSANGGTIVLDSLRNNIEIIYSNMMEDEFD